MDKNKRDIDHALTIYAELGLEKAVSALKRATDLKVAGGSFNTLYAKKAVKVSSFDIVSLIRKTTLASAYFHIPFCRNSCIYCVYEKNRPEPIERVNAYLAALEQEIEKKIAALGQKFCPDIFYVGGGTPTVFDIDQMRSFLRILSRRFDLKRRLEFTFETTPMEITRDHAVEKLLLLKDNGVNRINVGVESFSEAVTKKNGRVQYFDDITRCIETLRRVGFDKINIDLIYGLFGQNLSVWREDIDNAIALSPDSITTFALRVWKTSRLYPFYAKNKKKFCSEKDKITMRILAYELFTGSGYFEDNSDYFIKSIDKRYLYHPSQPANIFRNLIGFGPSAYSIAGDTHIFNTRKTADYIRLLRDDKAPVDSAIVLTRGEHMKKRFADGLRTRCDDRLFRKEFSSSLFDEFRETIEILLGMSLVSIEKPYIGLTKKGKLITDIIANYIKYPK